MSGLRKLARHVVRNAVAYVALFALLGGTALAAGTLLPKNSVGSAQVIDRSLASKDVKRGQAPGGARGLQGARGAVGPQGATGPQGPGAKAAASSAGTTPTPPATPAQTFQTASITLPADGKLLLVARLDSLSFSCMDTCTYTLGLYLDGQPVAGSGLDSLGTCPIPLLCFGSAQNVSLSAIVSAAAGAHQVALGGGVTVGPSFSPPTAGASQVAAIGLG